MVLEEMLQVGLRQDLRTAFVGSVCVSAGIESELLDVAFRASCF